MASALSDEEFHRMQLQLLELRTRNYELESKCKKLDREIELMIISAENTSKELQKAEKAISRSKKAKEVELLYQENDGLQAKLQSQEEDFRLQNQTLMQELSNAADVCIHEPLLTFSSIYRPQLRIGTLQKLQSQEEDFCLQTQTLMQQLANLVSLNEDLEKQVKDLTSENETHAAHTKSVDTAHLDDEIRRLHAQNSALQKKLSATQEKGDKTQDCDIIDGDLSVLENDITSSSEDHGPDTSQALLEPSLVTDNKADATCSIDSLKTTIEELRLSLDTEREEKTILKQELSDNEDKYNTETVSLQDEVEKLNEKFKRKHESYLHLQEEKETLFKESSTKLEDVQSSRDRNQIYYTEQINKLQLEIHKYQKSQEEMKSGSSQMVRQLQSKMAFMQQQLDAAAIVTQQQVREQAQKLQTLLSTSQAQVMGLTQQRDDLVAQLQESKKASQIASDQLCSMQQDRDLQIQAIQEANKVAEKRKTLLDDLAIKYQKDCDRNREQLLQMEDRHEAEVKLLRQKLDEEKGKSSELEKQRQIITDQQATITSLDESKAWLDRRLKDTEGSLDKTLEENDSTLVCLKLEHEETISNLTSTHSRETEDLKSSYESRLQKCSETEESHTNTIRTLEDDNKRLKQDIKDGVNDKKIHEKKGRSALKDLKKQLHAERKRAEKLQDRLQQVLTDTGQNKSMEELFQPFDHNDSWREDQSSVSSWSGGGASRTGTFTSFTTSHSALSASPHSSPLSPTVELPGDTQTNDVIERENAELLTRLAGLQQEKWDLEEKVRHLETSTSGMAEDLLEKSRVIEHYVMVSRTDTKPHHNAQHDDKISLKKVLDMVNKSEDQGLRDMNRKLQNMLEETLTKNMHLQQNLEVLSQEVVNLSKQKNNVCRTDDSTPVPSSSSSNHVPQNDGAVS